MKVTDLLTDWLAKWMGLLATFVQIKAKLAHEILLHDGLNDTAFQIQVYNNIRALAVWAAMKYFAFFKACVPELAPTCSLNHYTTL